MKKERPANRKTMKEVMNLNPEDLSNIESEENYAPAFEFTEEFDQKLISYNDRIKDLDSDYKAFRPYDNILLRLYVKPLERNESGLVVPHYEQVIIPTKSGQGAAAVVASPYPFSRKAVIVAVPDVEWMQARFNVGDTVLLSQKQVVARSTGYGEEAQIDVPNKFFLPDFYDRLGMPIDPENKSYGYILVNPTAIEGFI